MAIHLRPDNAGDSWVDYPSKTSQQRQKQCYGCADNHSREVTKRGETPFLRTMPFVDQGTTAGNYQKSAFFYELASLPAVHTSNDAASEPVAWVLA